jgi:hypothetical protein
MKKLLIQFPIVLILLVLSCSKVDEVSIKINSVEIAEGHHLLVEKYTNNPDHSSNRRVNCFPCGQPNLTVILNENKTNMIAQGYNQQDVENQTQQGLVGLQNLAVISVVDNRTTLIPVEEYRKVLINDLYKKRRITSALYYKLMEITTNSSVSETMNRIYWLENNSRSFGSVDKPYLNTFVAVGKDSYLQQGTGKLKPGSSTIIADAIGAIWGLPLGGVGSIIYGAAFSLYENEVL